MCHLHKGYILRYKLMLEVHTQASIPATTIPAMRLNCAWTCICRVDVRNESDGSGQMRSELSGITSEHP